MNDITNYIFRNMSSYEKQFELFAKVLKKQNSFNNWVALYMIVSTVSIYRSLSIHIQKDKAIKQLQDEVKRLDREIERLKGDKEWND